VVSKPNRVQKRCFQTSTSITLRTMELRCEFTRCWTSSHNNKRQESSPFCLRHGGHSGLFETINDVVTNTSSVLEFLEKKNAISFLNGWDTKGLYKAREKNCAKLGVVVHIDSDFTSQKTNIWLDSNSNDKFVVFQFKHVLKGCFTYQFLVVWVQFHCFGLDIFSFG
jgi:hypothetical protein